MKILLLTVLFVFSSILLSSQSFVTIGANYSTQSYSHNLPFGNLKLANLKLTPSVGFGYDFQVNEKWSYQPGIYLGDLGGINSPDKPKTIFAIYAASLNQYIDFKPKPWFSVGVSPSVHYIAYAGITGKSYRVVNGKEVYDDQKLTSWKKLPSHELNRFVFSIVPRVSFQIKGRWGIDLFYRSDLNSVGYPFRVLKYTLKGYGIGVNLRYQLKSK